MSSLRENICTFMITYCVILLKMRNVSNKSCRENQNTYFMLNNFSRKSCRLWDDVEKYGRAGEATGDDIIRCIRFACWLAKVTHTHTHTHTQNV